MESPMGMTMKLSPVRFTVTESPVSSVVTVMKSGGSLRSPHEVVTVFQSGVTPSAKEIKWS